MLGELEQVVLLAAMRVGDEAYGVTVLHELVQLAGREPSLATVHKTLARLEDKGYVASRMGEPTPTRGGRRRRHYAVTPAGRQAVRASIAALRRLANGLAVGWDTP